MDSEGFSKLFQAAVTQVGAVDALREQHERDIQTLESDVARLQESVSLATEAQEVLKTVGKQFFINNKAEVEEILSTSLSQIFPDAYRIVLEVSDTSKRAKILLYKNGSEDPVPPKDGTGQGVLAVASFVLRVYFLSKFRLLPIMLLDEKLVEIANRYMPQMGTFIKTLCTEHNLDILFITHVSDFAAYADQHFEVVASEETGRSELRRLL